MAVHSLDCCPPETVHGSVDCCLPETEGDARPWQYTVDCCLSGLLSVLRLRVTLGHGSTQCGLLSA